LDAAIGLSYALGISRQLTPLEVLMIGTSHVVTSHRTYRQFPITWKLATPFSRRKLARAIRTLGPALVALTFASAAHAQGTMDFSGAQTLMGTFKTFAMYAGAVICLGGLIFAGIRMMSGRFQDAIPGLFGALFGAGVLGWGAGWISSLTGQSF
jgi:TrbC/VIRB2 pilin